MSLDRLVNRGADGVEITWHLQMGAERATRWPANVDDVREYV